MKAVELARTGNKKSGWPELSDCLYHALAILHDGVFVTNDRRHGQGMDAEQSVCPDECGRLPKVRFEG